MAFPDGWGYRWPIAIHADSVITSPVSTWPCLVTDAHFPEAAWNYMQATGADLRFSADEAGTSELYYDAPRLSVAGQSAHLYVQVPTLASTADTTIWAWVGNAEATAPSAAWMQNTYPADWAAFWPMEEGTGTTVGDRTENANHGTLTNGPTWAAGEGGAVVECAEPDDFVDCGAMPQLLGAAQITVIVRCRVNAIGDFQPLWAQTVGANDANGIAITAGSVGTLNRYYCKVSSGSNAFGIVNGAIDIGVWHTEALVFDGTGTGNPGRLKMYRDGTALSIAAFLGTIPAATSSTPNPFRLNAVNAAEPRPAITFAYACALSRALSADELRVHNAQFTPATWASAGALVAVGGGAVLPMFGGYNLGKSLLRGANL